MKKTVFITAVLATVSPVGASPDGASLYAENCAACHGDNLEGQANWRVQNDDGSMRAPPHDDSGHTWHHADQMLRDYTRLGGEEALKRMGVTGVISAMPAFGEIMSDDEIDAVLTFIKSTWSPQMRDHQRTITEASK
ncbi:MAG: cytochrome c [Paracoccaceae bacterium]|nr:cytochrome c [Paracoccaceae bacterium]